MHVNKASFILKSEAHIRIFHDYRNAILDLLEVTTNLVQQLNQNSGDDLTHDKIFEILRSLDKMSQDTQTLTRVNQKVQTAMLAYQQSYDELATKIALLINSSAINEARKSTLNLARINLETLQEIVLRSQPLMEKVQSAKATLHDILAIQTKQS